MFEMALESDRACEREAQARGFESMMTVSKEGDCSGVTLWSEASTPGTPAFIVSARSWAVCLFPRGRSWEM